MFVLLVLRRRRATFPDKRKHRETSARLRPAESQGSRLRRAHRRRGDRETQEPANESAASRRGSIGYLSDGILRAPIFPIITAPLTASSCFAHPSGGRLGELVPFHRNSVVTG